MRIVIVGGVERNETAFREIAEAHGHELVFHSGHAGGRGSDALWRLSQNVDLLIVQTDVNSHNAAQIARRVARRSGIPLVLCRRCSPTRFSELVAGLDPPAAALAGSS
jgi:hypothetical protein